MEPGLELSIVLPVHDEEACVVECVRAWSRSAQTLGLRFEIRVVDDGSRDATPRVLEQLQRSVPELVVETHPRNRGYGAALSSGFATARGEWVLFSDADLQFDPQDLGGVWEARKGVLAVCGVRSPRKDSINRRLAGWTWTRLNGLLFGPRLRDLNCAFKLFPRRALRGLELRSQGAFVNAELMARVGRRKGRLVELPVRHYPRPLGEASGLRPDVVLRAFGELLRVGLPLLLRSGQEGAVPEDVVDEGAA